MSKWLLPLQRCRIGDHLNPDTTFFCFLATRPLEWKPYHPTTYVRRNSFAPIAPSNAIPPPLALSVHICLGHLQLSYVVPMALEWLIFRVSGCQFGASWFMLWVHVLVESFFFSQLKPHFASNLLPCYFWLNSCLALAMLSIILHKGF